MHSSALPFLGDVPFYLIGRWLLALYFFVPGVTKIFSFAATAEYMAQHGVPLVPVLLVLTIVIQVGGSILLALGIQTARVALLLAALVLLISIFMHDFWNVYENTSRDHELQNFIKNLGILAGLLVLAGSASRMADAREPRPADETA